MRPGRRSSRRWDEERGVGLCSAELDLVRVLLGPGPKLAAAARWETCSLMPS